MYLTYCQLQLRWWWQWQWANHKSSPLTLSEFSAAARLRDLLCPQSTYISSIFSWNLCVLLGNHIPLHNSCPSKWGADLLRASVGCSGLKHSCAHRKAETRLKQSWNMNSYCLCLVHMCTSWLTEELVKIHILVEIIRPLSTRKTLASDKNISCQCTFKKDNVFKDSDGQKYWFSLCYIFSHLSYQWDPTGNYKWESQNVQTDNSFSELDTSKQSSFFLGAH